MVTKALVDNKKNTVNQHPPLQIKHSSSRTPASHSFHSSVTMTLLLQKELIHAMVDRIEANLKLSIVKSKLMAEKARQAKIFQELQELQAQEDNDRSL
jgi:hypothetical protein